MGASANAEPASFSRTARIADQIDDQIEALTTYLVPQVPLLQTWPAAQTVPQAPQLALEPSGNFLTSLEKMVAEHLYWSTFSAHFSSAFPFL